MRVRAGKGRRAKQAAAEARAFFIGPIDQANRDRRTSVVLVGESAQDFERRHHAQAAVEPAAVGHGIEMAAEDAARSSRSPGSVIQRLPAAS